MPHPTHAFDDDSQRARDAGPGRLVDQPSPRDARYGVAVLDMFSDAGWTPVEPVRARDWHDTGSGSAVQWSETTFD